MEAKQQPMMEIRHLKQYFRASAGFLSSEKKTVKAVDDVSLKLYPGETLGLVGESGCGKTTLGKTAIRLIEPTGGKIIFRGQDITKLKEKQMREVRRHMQIVFQDPYGSLNNRMSIGSILREPYEVHGLYTPAERDERVREMLKTVGLRAYYANRYPHEFSGGQRQRVAIARALMLEPEFVVLDEPVSALDVSVQSAVMNLLVDLKNEKDLTYLFISHDLAVVRHISDRIGVMYMGKLVELCDEPELFKHTLHPYSQALLSAMPIPDPDLKRERIILQGDLPSPINLPSGCRFRTRCPYATARCAEEEPVLREVAPKHFCACHLHDAGNPYDDLI